MKEYLKRFFRLWPALAFTSVAYASAAFAQDVVTGSDDLTRSAALVIANLTPLLLALVKRWLPGEALPFAAPLIGAIGTLVLNMMTGAEVDPVIGTLAGSAGVGVRESLDQAKKAVGMR